jgi:hypothetical protein
MNKSSQHYCTLETFTSPRLSGILIGLEVKEGRCTPQPNYFPCCGGVGYQFNKASGVIKPCSLKKRIARVERLLMQFSAAWPGSTAQPPYRISANQSLAVLQNIHQVITAEHTRAVTLQGKKETPGLVWSIALACAYRFGLSVEVFTFGKDSSARLFNMASSRQEAPDVIILEQVDKLWDPFIALEFDSFINFAYQGNIPLWIEFSEQPAAAAAKEQQQQQQPQTHPLSAKGQLSRRINQLKQQSPLTFLAPSTISKLKAMRQVTLANPEKA